MGTVKRTGKKKPTKKKATKKTGKKKPTKKKATKKVAGINPLLLDDVDTLSTELVAVLEKIATQAQTPVVDGLFPQEAMQAYLKLQEISKRIAAPIGTALKELRDAAKAHEAAGAVFEAGRFTVIKTQSGGKRNPSWKGEAVKQASRAASLEHGISEALDAEEQSAVHAAALHFTFDEKAYEADVRDRTPKGKLTEGIDFAETA